MSRPSNTDLAKTLSSIIDTAIDGIITIDSSGIVELMNPAAASIFKYKPQEVIGHNIKMLMTVKDKHVHDQYISNYLQTKNPKIIGIGREVLGRKKDGEVFPFRLAVSEVILNDRIIFTGIIHDLTDYRSALDKVRLLNDELESKVVERTYELESVVNQLLQTNQSLQHEIKTRKEAEDQLRENQVQLTQALEKEKELNELKSRFVSMASHEFRTPLASILSSASLINRYTQDHDQENRQRHIEKIKSAVSNLTGILNDFLSLSKLEENKIIVESSTFDITDLIHEVIEETETLRKDNQNIIINLKSDSSSIRSDRRILKNIFFNLITNAIKYSDNDIWCVIEDFNEHYKIDIIDKGIGIPLEDQKHLFNRFFRAANAINIQGTGLGLNIVSRYLKLIGGEIRYSSELNEGTTFSIVIPKSSIEK